MIGIDDVFVLQIQRSGLVGQVHGAAAAAGSHGKVSQTWRPAATLRRSIAQAHTAILPLPGPGAVTTTRGFSVSTKIVCQNQNTIRCWRIAAVRVMPVYANAQLHQLVRERLCRRLAAILRDHHAVGAQAARARLVDQAECVRVVCNVQIATPLGMLDVVGVEHQHQFLANVLKGILRLMSADPAARARRDNRRRACRQIPGTACRQIARCAPGCAA